MTRLGPGWFGPGWFLALGAASGALAAAATLYPLGDVAAPVLFGMCFGMGGPGGHCGGIGGSFYLFPGLIFGVSFGAAQWWLGRFDAARALAFAAASGVANAVAVFLCIWLFDVFGNLIGLDLVDLPLALAGAIAGAAGTALAGGATALLVAGAGVRRSIAAGAALGLLVPLVIEGEIIGDFVFYICWQAGYALALALAAGLAQRPGTVSA